MLPRRQIRRVLTIVPALGSGLLLSTATRILAQTPMPPVRPLGHIVATSHEMLASVASVRALSDGRLLANDPAAHRVVLFDSTLATFTIVADTTPTTAKAYGQRPGGLIRYRGDTSLFADPASLSLLVIDPAGKIVRTVSAPLGPSGGVGYLITPIFKATPDGLGNITYRFGWSARSTQAMLSSLPTVRAGDPPIMLLAGDSALIVRSHMASRTRDTIATMAISPQRAQLTPTGTNTWNVVAYQGSAIPVSDDWTVLPDGTLAIVRVADYHIDWLSPAGVRSSSPRIAHEWTRYSDSARTAIIDSVTRMDSIAREQDYAEMVASAKAAGRQPPLKSEVMGREAGTKSINLPNGITETFSIIEGGFDGPGSVPDYPPPFVTINDSTGTSAVSADADGNLWIRVNQPKPLPGGPLFDIVNRQGALVDRIQIPGGTAIVGFGPGVVYLTSRDGVGYHIARARIH